MKTVQAAPMNDPTSLHSMAAGEGAKVPAVRRPEPRKHLHGVEVERRETSGGKWRLGAAVIITLLYSTTNHHTAQSLVSSVTRRTIRRTNKPFVMFVM